jgi:N-acyl-D-aspartate/D-glutamate deacylase
MPQTALIGGRVVDPATNLDAIRNVAIDAGRIVAVTEDPIPNAEHEIDVSGAIVAPGFIDLHSHTHSIVGHRLQALDGVTTALDLEAGLSPIEQGYRSAAEQGRPLNYGFSASWGVVRMHVVDDIPLDGRLATFLDNIASPTWQQETDAASVGRILDLLAKDLDNGALGVGMLMGYAQGVDPNEYVEVAKLTKVGGTALFTHARDLVEDTPEVRIDGANEIVNTAIETGARMHYCHINSTSRRRLDRVHELVSRAVQEGSRVSTEAYPYGAGSTGIGAVFLAPERLSNWGLQPSAITYVPTGERIADAARLRELREKDPGGLVIIDFLDENKPEDREYLLRALSYPDAMIASDAMPITWRDERPDPNAWPIAGKAVTHPRTAGTYAKSYRWLVRETERMSTLEFVARASTYPARFLAEFSAAMRRKGSVEPGYDADLVVFDPAALTDQATYADSTRPSTGVRHLFVNGEAVVADGRIVLDAFPGRAIRSG